MVAFPLGSRGKSKYGLGKGLWLRLVAECLSRVGDRAWEAR